MWYVTSRYRTENRALWLHESDSGCRRLAISRATVSTHCGFPALQMLFGSLGTYGPARPGSSVDQSVTRLPEVTVDVVVDRRSAETIEGATARASEMMRALNRVRAGRAMVGKSPVENKCFLEHVSNQSGVGTGWYRHRMTAADHFSRHVADVDPEIAELLESELRRQETTLEMIASENFVPQAILDCQGSVLTNKYAEGYPGRRYYGGCEYVDVVEQLAIDRAKEVFGAEHVNVQPHAGAQTNAAVYHALIQPGDTIMGMKLDQGGHLSHGMKLNVSGRLYNVVAYGVDHQTSRVDMEEVARVAEEFRPKIIIAGWSAYPRQLDFAAFREVADSIGAILLVDMAHFAGLVAADEHPSPVPHADVVTTTVHKTIGGARGGMILCREDYAKKIDSAVFPGQQGGPLMHVIAGKAVAMKIAQTEAFRERQQRTRTGAAAVAEEMISAGVNVLSGGTDVHLVLADLRESDLDGKQAEDRLHDIGITVNRNAVPNDPRPPAVSSGLRIGTPALATRGLQADDFREIGRIIGEALTQDWSDERRSDLSDRVRGFAERYPLYPNLAGTYAGATAAV